MGISLMPSEGEHNFIETKHLKCEHQYLIDDRTEPSGVPLRCR